VPFPEHGFGPLDPGAVDVAHRALTGAHSKLPGKVEPAQADQGGELIERDVLAQVGIDVGQTCRRASLPNPP
jgi:hypothetical protein